MLTIGRSRCFKHWQEFLACYSGTDELNECELLRRDYVECLHHTGEQTRARIIASEKRRQAGERAKEQDEQRRKAESASRSKVARLDVLTGDK